MRVSAGWEDLVELNRAGGCGVEPIVVAVIGAIGGLASGVAVSLLKPFGEDWQARQRETRARRREDLDRMADAVRGRMDPNFLRIGAASIADDRLIEYVGRYITADSTERRSDAQGGASNRIGELRAKL
jgi:hypothetical protein